MLCVFTKKVYATHLLSLIEQVPQGSVMLNIAITRQEKATLSSVSSAFMAAAIKTSKELQEVLTKFSDVTTFNVAQRDMG